MPDGDQGQIAASEKESHRDVAERFDVLAMSNRRGNRHDRVDDPFSKAAKIGTVFLETDGNWLIDGRWTAHRGRYRPIRASPEEGPIAAEKIIDPGPDCVVEFSL